MQCRNIHNLPFQPQNAFNRNLSS